MQPMGLPNPLGLRLAVAAGQRDMDDTRVHGQASKRRPIEESNPPRCCAGTGRRAQPVGAIEPEHLQPVAIGRLLKEDDMTIIPISLCNRIAGGASKPAIALVSIASVLSPADLAAQGQPVQNGPMLPVALWWIGAFVLGLAIVYGIFRNRPRTRAESRPGGITPPPAAVGCGRARTAADPRPQTARRRAAGRLRPTAR